MNTTSREPLIALSERIYRALLVLYPADYRRDYGVLMAQVFRDMCRTAYREHGTAGIVLWWLTTLLDLALTVLEQWRKVEIHMSSISHFLQRIGGVLLVVAGVLLCIASAAELQPGQNYPLRGIYQVFGFMFAPAIILISLGTLGMALKYQNRAGSVGRRALFGAVGGVLVIIAYMIFVLFTGNENLWNMFLGGMLLHAASLVVFGLTALGMRPLPRWNWLPIVIGVMPFSLLVVNSSRNGINTEWENIIAYVVMGIGYAALGYVMLRDRVREKVQSPVTA